MQSSGHVFGCLLNYALTRAERAGTCRSAVPPKNFEFRSLPEEKCGRPKKHGKVNRIPARKAF